MPADLKDLICSMLQKNPQARPNWQQLKDHSFFKQN
jgi:serine/threonine protein kinase